MLNRVGEKVIPDDLFLKQRVLFRPIRQDHVEDALKGIAHHFRILRDDVEIFVECPLPVLLAELLLIQARGNQLHEAG